MEVTKVALLTIYKEMQTMRRTEMAADVCIKRCRHHRRLLRCLLIQDELGGVYLSIRFTLNAFIAFFILMHLHQENVQYNFGQLWQLCKVVKLPKLSKLLNFVK